MLSRWENARDHSSFANGEAPALWWVERWVRGAEADATGAPDPELTRDAGYYSDRVVERVDRLGRLLEPAP